MKYSFIILLFTALIVQSFSRTLLLADYMINLETFKKNCVNKAKPMLHCHGKCQMLKKLHKHEGENGTNAPVPKFNQEVVVISSQTFFPIVDIFTTNHLPSFYTYNSLFSSNYIGSIFHPPGV